MSECAAFYDNALNAIPGSSPWLKAVRERARHDFVKRGLPTKALEAWRYTSLDGFANARFSMSTLPNPDKAAFPEGVTVMPLLDAIEADHPLVKHHFNKVATSVDGLMALNSASFQNGMLIVVPKNQTIAAPIWLKHSPKQTDEGYAIRHLVILEEGASLTLIEDYDSDKATWMNTAAEIVLAPHARLAHYKVQHEGEQSFHTGYTWVKQDAHSDYQSHMINLSTGFSRNNLVINLDAAHAHCMMNGLYLTKNKAHCDYHTTVHHHVGFCGSDQNYKGILFDKSRAVFNGQVIVAKGADKTVAKQQNKNLLLSTTAEIDTKPELQIFADDVICTHGATVGQLDNDALFDVQARGLSPDEARLCLIEAFLAENINAADGAIKDWLNTLMHDALQKARS